VAHDQEDGLNPAHRCRSHSGTVWRVYWRGHFGRNFSGTSWAFIDRVRGSV